MEIVSTEIADVKILTPRRFADPRGVFCETWSQKTLDALGVTLEFVQDNQSISVEKGVVRGLHFQTKPFAQDKLVRVVKGAILDVAVDLRKSSPTFGRHVKVELSADNWRQLLVPVGFAHGFVTLEADTQVVYKVSNYYSKANDGGVLWNDPALGIDWGISQEEARLSDKDRTLPLLKDLGTVFE